MMEASSFVVGIGDIFPTQVDSKDHPMLPHVLVHVLDLKHICLTFSTLNGSFNNYGEKVMSGVTSRVDDIFILEDIGI